MRLSRSMLFLVSALALPVVAAGGCGDDSGDSNDKPSDQPSDDDNGGGEIVGGAVKKDAGSSKMDATVTPGSGDGGSSATTSDAGETTNDAGNATVDAGAATDAAAEGMDAATDAGKDAGADAGKDAAGDKVDAAGEPEQDASEPEQDASEPEQDASEPEQDASSMKDAGDKDAVSQTDTATEQECADNQGLLKPNSEPCADGQTTYPIEGGEKNCCIGETTAPIDGDCQVGVVNCPEKQFCDYSRFGGGTGCPSDEKSGKCRAIPNDACDDVPRNTVGCGCDGLPHSACDAWQKGISLEVLDFSCQLGIP